MTHEAAADEQSAQNLPPVRLKPSAIKLPIDFFDSAKIRILCGQKGGANVVMTYLMMVMLAAKSNQNGALYVADGIPYDAEMLASLTQMDVSAFKKTLELLVKYGLIEEKDGILDVIGYSRLVVYEPSKRRSSGKKSGK